MINVQVSDEGLLDVMFAARQHGALVCVHAREPWHVKWMGERLVARGYTDPKYHAVSHPRAAARSRLFERLISFWFCRPARCVFTCPPRKAPPSSGGQGAGRHRGSLFCRDVPTLPVHDRAGYGPVWSRGREMDLLPAPAHMADQEALAGSRDSATADALLGPRALSLRCDRQALRRLGSNLQADCQWHAGHRDAPPCIV